MWEYTIREFVQEWGDPGVGRQGWEAVGLAPRTHYDRGGGPPGWDSYTFVVLLKRRAVETPPQEQADGGQSSQAEN